MIQRFAAAALCLLVACAPVSNAGDVTTRAAGLVQNLPPIKAFGSATDIPAQRSNSEMSQDFMDLVFRLESGRPVERLTRFEGPITVRFDDEPTETLIRDLDALLARLRAEAGINIIRTDAPEANITIDLISGRQLRNAVPNAACFVVPNVSSWQEFQQFRGTDRVDWSSLTERKAATIFLPIGAAPQEQRDCLHEELAQALGPLNDLYRIPDTVFNDDNIHNVLTGFDMLILRAVYAPELSNGMSPQDVANRLPALMARLNPAGELLPPAPVIQTPPNWSASIEAALSNRASVRNRQRAAQSAINIAEDAGWSDVRQGFAHYALGRLTIGSDAAAALSAFQLADVYYGAAPEMQIHSAHVAVQKAAFTLAQGDAEGTLTLTDTAIPIAFQHQNAALLSTLMMFKAEALEMKGNAQAADTVRLDSLGWARYGFGSDRNVQARLAEIASLRPF